MDDARLREALEALSQLLGRDDLAPDETRRDWATHRGDLDAVKRHAEEAAEALEALVVTLAPTEAEAARGVVAEQIADAAVLLHVAGDRAGGRALLDRAVALVAHSAEAGLVGEAGERFDDYARLVHAWWLFRHGERDAALAIAKRLSARSSPEIAASAKVLLEAPAPISGPPSLFTLNGFGLTIYGDRDAHPDGSHVKTRFLAALFVPILPLDAWRVLPADEGGFYFLGKVPLSGLTRWWRRLALVAIVGAVASGAWESHVESPEYRAARAWEAAAALETSGNAEGAVDAYASLAEEFPFSAPDRAAEASDAMVRLLVGDGSDAGGLLRAVKRYEGLGWNTKGSHGGGRLAMALLARGRALAAEDLEGGLELLKAGERVAPKEHAAELREARGALQTKIADRDAAEWPLDAIRTYAAVGGHPGAVAGAERLVAKLGDGPSVWAELAEPLSVLRDQATQGKIEAPAISASIGAVTEAKRHLADAARAKTIAEGDIAALRVAFEAVAGDQEVAAALARRLRASGKSEEAMEILTALGPPGLLVRAASGELAALQVERGQLAAAEALLDRQLRTRLPAFEEARRAYDAATERTQEALIRQARAGSLPRALSNQLDRETDEEARQRLFSEWLSKQLEDDPQLVRLREAYFRFDDVVPLALQLGTVQLRRANAASGEVRKRLLDKAEHVFLSIQAEASGAATFHLGLGQVYHRLGKTEAGEKELRGLIERGEPALSLAVAQTYRELGRIQRARETATAVFENAAMPTKGSAAILMALIATDRADRKEWFGKADQKGRFVRMSLLEIEAIELQLKGEDAKADAKFAEVAREFERDAAHDDSAANNAALAYQSRFTCTGDTAHLATAARLMEGALRLSPDNALVVANTARQLEYGLVTETLAEVLPMRRLRLGLREAKVVIDALLQGPERASFHKRICGSPQLRRLLELSRQGEVLEPGSAEPYERQRAWLLRCEDVRGLEALADRVARLRGLDDGDARSDRDGWISGAKDDEIRTSLDDAITRLDKLGTRMKRAPGRAVAALLKAGVLRTRAMVADTVESWQAMESACRAALGWPALGAQRCVADALLFTAIKRGTTASESLGAAWRSEGRALGSMAFFLKHRAGPELAVLREQPELAKAGRLLEGPARILPRKSDWVVAKATGNAALEKAAQPAFSKPTARLDSALRAKLAPYDPAAAMWAALNP